MPLLLMLVELLPKAVVREKASGEYFELLRTLMGPEERRLYLVVRGLLGQLCRLLGEEAERVAAQEESCMVDLAQGTVLKTLIELLQARPRPPRIAQHASTAPP